MKSLRYAIFVVFFISHVLLANEQTVTNADQPAAVLIKLERIENSVTELRRDQLNYTIEKDLLKETYSSNLETVNLIITLILGTFTILAFFGIKSVGTTRQEFRQELEKLRNVRAQSEERLKEIENQQKQSKERLEEITSTNEEQNQRLKLLEIQENASLSIARKQYSHALDYLTIGLDIDANNLTLLRYREFCLLKLKQFDNAMETMEQILEIDPKSSSTALNLCELLCLMKRDERFTELENRYREEIQKRPHLSWFFKSINMYIKHKDDELKAHIESLLSELPAKEEKHMSWRFEEAVALLSTEKERAISQPLFKTFKVLGGGLLPSEVFESKSDDKSTPNAS